MSLLATRRKGPSPRRSGRLRASGNATKARWRQPNVTNRQRMADADQQQPLPAPAPAEELQRRLEAADEELDVLLARIASVELAQGAAAPVDAAVTELRHKRELLHQARPRSQPGRRETLL